MSSTKEWACTGAGGCSLSSLNTSGIAASVVQAIALLATSPSLLSKGFTNLTLRAKLARPLV
jgi:hypothetical protein